MNKIDLVKTYSANKGNLLLALNKVIKNLYSTVIKEEQQELDEIKKYIGVLASIIQDIDHTDKTLDVINKIDEKKE